MDAHFRAFSFVDQITHLEPGVCIRGRYAVPAGVEVFPVSLVSEAVGQLAAWAAMAEVRFTHRPVAGIAGTIELLSAVGPGQLLDLAVDLESVDEEMIGYSGTAHTAGVPVVRLKNCVGPMVPLQDFDDPAAVQGRFTMLNRGGAAPGAFAGLPVLDLRRVNGEVGLSARAELRVPAQALFFGDHFPRRPVFPGTLLMHANLQTAAMLAAEVPCAAGAAWSPRLVSDVKLRTFISPGETLQLIATRGADADNFLRMTVESRLNQRLVGSADVQFAPEPPL
jgi:3-hydroxymyristoyl/3-hydroxydecanoyl-(acyl carrier protein) dehydratase